MKSKKRNQKRALGQLFGVLGIFLFFGVFLILHVWLPVQAQRAKSELKKWETRVSQEKALYDYQNREYGQVTSLLCLDEWATGNGPWRVPKGHDILMVYE